MGDRGTEYKPQGVDDNRDYVDPSVKGDIWSVWRRLTAAHEDVLLLDSDSQDFGRRVVAGERRELAAKLNEMEEVLKKARVQLGEAIGWAKLIGGPNLHELAKPASAAEKKVEKALDEIRKAER